MELKEFYKKLRSFVDEDPTDKTDEELLYSLLSVIECVNIQAFRSRVNREGMENFMQLYGLRDKFRDIKRSLIANAEDFKEMIEKRTNDVEIGFNALYDYIDDDIQLSGLKYEKEELEKEITILRQSEEDFSSDESAGIEELNRALRACEEEEARIIEHQPLYQYCKDLDRLQSIEGSYEKLLALTTEAHSAIKDFLDEDTASSFLRKLDQDFRFGDIVDEVFKLFHDVLFKPGLTRPQLLLALNLQGPPVQLVNDSCKAAASVMIQSIASYYLKDDPAFQKEWEQKAPPQFSVPLSSYKSRKGDAKEENHIKDWKVGEKWVDFIIEFRRYLTELYKLKHPNSADWKAKSE